MPAGAELWLLEAVAPELVGHLDDCLASGMLVSAAEGVAFRHELARLAVEESLPPGRRTALHRTAVSALAHPPVYRIDLARLAHHADAAGDGETVLRVAPEAAAQAAAVGAHREAAAQYARALRFAGELEPATQADLLERRAYECHLTEQPDEAIAAQEQALLHHRALGDRQMEGDALRWLSRFLWCAGRVAEADATGEQAVSLLGELPPGRSLALAYANLAQLRMNDEDLAGSSHWGERALELARRLRSTDIEAHALNSIGTAEFLAGREEGRRKLERSLELAGESGGEYDVARAFAHLAWGAMRQHAHAVLLADVDTWLEYCSGRDLELTRSYLLACLAVCELERGLWDESSARAELVLGEMRSSLLPRTLALTVLGLVRARRGDPDAWSLLDEARTLAEPTGELQRVVPVAAARAEAAWLTGRSRDVAGETERAFGLALERHASWPLGELACWRRRAGVDEPPPDAVAEPYACELAGDWSRAADGWDALGCPYEAALARASSDDEEALRDALDGLQRLGATPAAAIVARRLRKRGARAVRRGPRRTTRTNPANLTVRQLEVLELVAEGLQNAQIAERLFLSTRTVDHHVSAVLRKLGVSTRGQATREAVRLGLLGPQA